MNTRNFHPSARGLRISGPSHCWSRALQILIGPDQEHSSSKLRSVDIELQSCGDSLLQHMRDRLNSWVCRFQSSTATAMMVLSSCPMVDGKVEVLDTDAAHPCRA
jgi:hypothetical protein